MSVKIRYSRSILRPSATKTIHNLVRVDNTNAKEGRIKVTVARTVLPKSLNVGTSKKNK